jgi:hypothetical protein
MEDKRQTTKTQIQNRKSEEAYLTTRQKAPPENKPLARQFRRVLLPALSPPLLSTLWSVVALVHHPGVGGEDAALGRAGGAGPRGGGALALELGGGGGGGGVGEGHAQREGVG